MLLAEEYFLLLDILPDVTIIYKRLIDCLKATSSFAELTNKYADEHAYTGKRRQYLTEFPFSFLIVVIMYSY